MKCVPHAARPVTTFAVLASLRRPEGVCAAGPRRAPRALPRPPCASARQQCQHGPGIGAAVGAGGQLRSRTIELLCSLFSPGA